MESNFLTTIFLPLALFLIMLGMGLGLTIKDFNRIWLEPKAVVIGLIAQLVMLPLVGFALASLFSLSPELAVGVMILAACPGGSTSNVITYLLKGNVALSITLTAISSLVTIITIPLVVNLSANYFMGEQFALQLPFLKTVLQIAVITIVPVSLGMIFYHFFPKLATLIEQNVKWLSLFFLGTIIVAILVKERQNLAGFFLQVGGVTITLNLLTMALGYGIAMLVGLGLAERKSITIEVGIQNGTLAIAIATTLLNNPMMAIPAAIYSIVMFLSSAIFAGLLKSKIFAGIRSTEKYF
ncbi:MULTISPECIES: bile acid:sodium symporter family protein [unclassified Synechocystis]|uniref:bile acid:sodium symporter family protein n=1 Tax=unclassified Synechocystis TaxID=2640012 RepID=UPI0003F59637|nr:MULTISPECIES: bile acid:sodium symporter family protein [unclassified Synechocystis]AIE74632.1 Sodium-dependent transporter [Synechocystis sp. PCC 6714]MCT0254009.1 bile acid:sodium symporter family protein [Synechocystis sp. CS-94]